MKEPPHLVVVREVGREAVRTRVVPGGLRCQVEPQGALRSSPRCAGWWLDFTLLGLHLPAIWNSKW